MRLTALATAVFLLAPGLQPLAAGPQPAALTAPTFTAADLMASFGLDRVFVEFGETIASSPRRAGITDTRFLAAWESAALEAFSIDRLNGILSARLAQDLDGNEIDLLGQFMASDFGIRLGALEQQTHNTPADRQIAIIAEGQALWLRTSPQRRARFEELLSLSGADMVHAILRESIRGMAFGLNLGGKSGDISRSWEEVDAEVNDKLAGMRDSLDEATRAVFAYTYASLSDDELEAYLGFLRGPAARKLYALTTAAIGDILQTTMFDLGREVGRRLQQVRI